MSILPTIHVLHIEDNLGHSFLIEEMLADSTSTYFSIDHCVRLDEALARLAAESYDIILVDPGLPDSQGPQTLERICAAAPRIPIVALSATSKETLELLAVPAGIQDYLSKGHFDADTLQLVIRYAIERQRTTQALRDSERQYRDLIEQASDGIFIADQDGKLLDANSEACSMLGYTRPELLLKHIADIVIVEEEDPENMSNLLAGRTVRAERSMMRKDGTLIPVETNTKLLADGRLQAIARDITERKSSELALRESEERFRAQYKGNPIPVSTWRRAGDDFVLVDYNDEALVVTDGLIAQQLGTRLADSNMFNDEAKASANECFNERRFIRNEIEVSDPESGETRTLLMTYVFVPPNMVSIHAYDLTERKRIETERRAREAAEMASRAKSAFLSRMSHELRTPLNAILGFAQLLQMNNITAEQQESVGYILSAGQHLLGMINEVLDITRVEQGRINLMLEPVQVEDLISEALDMVSPLAAVHQVQLEHNMVGTYNFEILVDRQKLRQVMLNLLSNAIKYNHPGGSIIVHCGADPSMSALRVSVSDTGIGIATNMIERLFTPFDRLGAEQSLIEGTGLGLVLARLFIEAMGGEIGVRSQQDYGSTFWIDIPLKEDAKEESQVTIAEFSALNKASTVLYIEEDRSSVERLEHALIERPTMRLIPASRAAGIISVRDQHPDLILLPLETTDWSGEELLRHLKADPSTSNIPVVVISDAAARDKYVCTPGSGAQAYFSNTLDTGALVAMIDKLLA